MKDRGILLPKTPQETLQLMNVALGKEKADLAVVNARLVNVYTGELLEDQAITVKDKWIAYVGKNAEDAIGPQTEIIDAQGQTVIPGLIDGHTHIAWQFTTAEFLRYAIAGGTTTVVTETLEPYPVSGYDGVTDFLESLKKQPIKILATAPAMVSISRKARGVQQETLDKLLARDDVIGLGLSLNQFHSAHCWDSTEIQGLARSCDQFGPRPYPLLIHQIEHPVTQLRLQESVERRSDAELVAGQVYLLLAQRTNRLNRQLDRALDRLQQKRGDPQWHLGLT